MVINHGRGTDEADLFPLLDELDPDRRLVGITPGAPLTDVPPGGRHWYLVPRVGYPDPPTFHRSYGLLTEFCDATLADFGIEWARTVIGGFSMGAAMSYAVGLGSGRPSPAGIIALSGFIPTVDGWEADLDRTGLPVFIHHGSRDPVIDVSFARRAVELLTAADLDVVHVETDAGHWLPPQIVPRLRDFVERACPSP